MKRTICLAALVFCGVSLSRGDVIVTDNFSDGNRTANPAWYISAGAFDVNGGAVFNNNSTVNQFFTTSFSGRDVADGTGLRLSLAYRPDGANLSSLRVGIYSGSAVTADNWSQFVAGQPTRGWLGYYAIVGLTNNSASSILFNNNAVDDHAFFNGTTISASGAGTNVAGVLSFRTLVLEMSRDGSDMLVEVFEGPNAGNLISLSSATHAGGTFNGFNNIAFFQTTSSGNGSIRYDDVNLSTFVVPEPSVALLVVLGGILLASRRRMTAHSR